MSPVFMLDTNIISAALRDPLGRLSRHLGSFDAALIATSSIVASEMLLGGVGVGFFIWDQYNASRISDIVVALAWVGLTGFFLDRIVAFAGRIVSRGDALS